MYRLPIHLPVKAFSALLIMLSTLSAFAGGITDTPRKYEPDGRWMVRLMGQRVTPIDLSSEISVIGGRLDTPPKSVASLDLSYFVTDYWSVELQGGPFSRSYRIVGSKAGTFDVGTISNVAASMAVLYHISPQSQISPYIGVGFSHAWVKGIERAEGIPQFRAKDVTSAIVCLGIDYKIDQKWLFSAGLRYIMSPDYTFDGDGFKSTVSMNTLMTGAGVGFRF
jgi:outer membrane protein